MCFSWSPPAVSSLRKGDLIFLFLSKSLKSRNIIETIRVINSSSYSVSNPDMKKHMVGNSMDFCEYNVVGGLRVSISQEGGVDGGWVGGRWRGR